MLLEHGIAFDEVFVVPAQDPALPENLPLAKEPYLQIEHGDLCESQCIVEYLAARLPSKRIFSADPWLAAKEREMIFFVDVPPESTARDVYKEAFFGGTVSDATRGYAGIDWKSYVKNIDARPAAQRASADRKAYIEAPARASRGNEGSLMK